MAKNRNQSDEKIKYLVREGQGSFVIELPASWKLTFAAVNPAGNSMGRHGDLHCLRVWEGEKLRAVFCDIRGFRDLSVPLARKIEKETGSAKWTGDSVGNFEMSATRQIEEEIVHENIEELTS